VAFSQEVAITVDDLPSHGALPPGMTRSDVARSILKALKDARAPKVHGFVNAKKLEQHPEDIEVLKLWRSAGFPLGNHTYAHLSLNVSTAEEFDKNFAADEPELKSLMGRDNWHWFRYPYLWEGDTLEKRHAVRQYLKDHKYHVAQVTLDFEDYLWNGPYARCAEKNDTGSIDWLKSTYLAMAAEYIALDRTMAKLIYGREIKHVLLVHIGGFETVMLPQLLEYLKMQNFQFITLPEAEKDSAYKSDPDLAMKDGGTLLDQMMDARHLPVPPHNEKPYEKLNALCR
jgi:peptidoglycan-N-acetylglucosamine deacetylase